MPYKATIGLEIHIELNTESKMFCSCLNDSDEKKANTNICPVCMGHPGTLPVINEAAVRKVLKTGLALNCHIPKYSKFDRKNYFYPDLPKGYQISQHEDPLCKKGYLKIDDKKIRIRRVHLEEDTARLIHQKNRSLVDFNRAGVPLMELVTEPDISSAKEAGRFAEELQLVLRYLDVSRADMEKGEFRVEANVSLSKDAKKLGTKTEVKNLNSFKSVEKAIDYEIKRQAELLNSGKKVVQETMGWDKDKGITLSQREKEESHDYRYLPEPDLPPLHTFPELIENIKAEIPELPFMRRERYKKEYNLLEEEIEVLVQDKSLGEYYEEVMSELKNWVKEIDMKNRVEKEEFFKLTKLCANYLLSDLRGLLKSDSRLLPADFLKKDKEKNQENKKLLITPENFAEFISLIYKGKISSKTAKMILEEMFETGADPSQVIKEKDLFQVTDESEIEEMIKEVILKNPKAVEDFKKGKTASIQFLTGKVMAVSKGKADPQVVGKLIKKLLT